MSECPDSEQGIPPTRAELYFLIAKFLAAGPCQKAAEALRLELEEQKLLPKRIDWNGGEHQRSYENLVDVNKHIEANHLFHIVQRIGPLLEKDVKPIVRGVTTLLGAGRQSLLRTIEDVSTVKWPNRTFVAHRHGCPLQPPKNLRHHPNFAVIHHATHLSGAVRRSLACGGNMYSKISLMSRSLGHLSAVYCVTFDRTGKYIITGADDHLIKIWSSVSGRLLATLRGHAGEITDIAVNYENTLLAAGSCDKMIRVWCLKTVTPVAVLHAHTGMITSLQFCPIARGDQRFLLSTGADGCLCFWQWGVNTHNFNPKPIKFIERSRAGAQLLCSSFSPGGVFLATGSTDHVVRVYCFTSSVPEKICELEAHTDRVDSIQYGSRCDRFVSGSKDGTARIWRFERHEWKAIVIDVGKKLNNNGVGSTEPDVENKKDKPKVTMVGWSGDDHYVITAVSDFSLKVWDSYTGVLIHVLKGHTDEAFVIEHNPVDHNIIVSAGHDGHIILWNLYDGTQIKSFFNMIEGQGHGAVFDCKWSPDGQTFAATDSHGFSMIFGFGSSEKYRRLPEEMFFHTDYRPLIRDANSYVLDEQTQQPPHLMPPPFLVDIDGNPHPPKLQRLVPGREGANSSQLIPQIGITPSGDREVLDLAIGDIPVENDPPAAAEAQEQAGPSGHRPSIDEMIQRMQREQDQRRGPGRDSAPRVRSPRREGPMSPPHNRGPRRSGEVEGVRQSSGNVPMSQHATARDIDAWSRRVVVRELEPALARYNTEWRQHVADEEIKKFILEKKKKPLPSAEASSDSETPYMKTRRRKSTGGSRSRRNQTQETGRNRLTARALYDTEEEEEEESGHDETVVESDHDIWNSDSSSDGDSSDYSDWTADAGVDIQPPKRTSQRKPKRKKFSSSEEDDDEEYVEDEKSRKSPTPKKKKPPPKSKRERRAQQRKQRVLSQGGERQELPEEFRPPEWLTETKPHKVPYYPQIGDEVIYFRQGHLLYVLAVKRQKIYDNNPNKNQPWHKVSNLREHELVKIIGLKIEVRPPRLVCLKLARIDPESGRLTGGSFTVKYHDMPDVLDFLVLRQTYRTAMQRNWKIGDRFRCLIDDGWWMGTIVSQEPLHSEFQDSMFQCFNVAWDNGEAEKMSPWDLEPLDDDRMPVELGGSVPVTEEELKALQYHPSEVEWPGANQELECERIAHGFEQIMEFSIAEPFLAPVDLNVFPIYAIVIEYPIDLSTINSRLKNHFYRRIASIQYDVRYLETNAAKFNEPNSKIVKCAKLLTELLLRFIADHECTDPMPIYSQLTRDANFAIGAVARTTNGDGASSMDGANQRKTSESALLDTSAWKGDCRFLINMMFQCEDSQPFRNPVDPMEYPEYRAIITTPMDLGTVREHLSSDIYETPVEFCKDVRLVFNNSRAYNTNKRSKIYLMTLKMSAMFEDLIRDIINDWKTALKYQKTGKLPPGIQRKFNTRQLEQASSSRSISGSSSTPRNTRDSSSPPHAAASGAAGSSRSSRSHGTSRSATVPKKETRQTRPPAKRKREDSSNSDTEEGPDVDSEATLIDSVDEEEDSDFELKQKPNPSKRKAPPKKKVKSSLVNGNSSKKAYSTRYSTGNVKRKKYKLEDEEEEEEEVAKGSSSNSSDSGSGSSSGSGSGSSSGSSKSGSSSSESGSGESESGSGSSSESDDEGVRRSRRTTTRQSTKATRSEIQRRTSQRPTPPKRNTFQEEFALVTGGGSRSGRRNPRPATRNRGKRTVRYEEDSDFDYDAVSNGNGDGDVDDDDDDSEEEEDERPSVTMSSRGRIRRLTPRARAFMGD